MKKLIKLTLILTFLFTTCDLFNDNGEYGKKGQGGGYIFFAEGGQYMECSGELGDTTWAAAVTNAKNHRGGGFTDWHLPTRNELDLMYKNLHKNELGGFYNRSYWTSESYAGSEAYAWYILFYSGSQDYWYKTDSRGVRAVRSYTYEPESATKLTIINQTTKEISNVKWNNVNFAGTNSNYIKNGETVTKNVEAGGGFIYFKLGTISYQTNYTVNVVKGRNEIFTFTNNTYVIGENNNLPVMLGGL